MAENDIEYLGSGVPAPPPINIINFENYRTNNDGGWSGGSHNEIEIVEEDEEEEEEDVGGGRFGGFRVMPSITEEYDSSNPSDLFSYDINRNMNDVVYVVTWRGTEEMSSASMDALLWTLGNNLNDESTFPSYSS